MITEFFNMSLNDFFVVFAVAIVAIFFVSSFFLMRQGQAFDEALETLEDSMNASGQGMLLFDEYACLQTMNKHAREYLSLSDDTSIDTQEHFLNYLFDHAVDVDEGLRRALTKSSLDPEGANFREIIRTDEGVLCLVDVRKMESGRTVILIRDVTRMRAQEEHVLALNKINHELNQAIESTTCAVLLSDPKARNHPVLFANHACCAILGVRKDEIEGVGLDEFFKRLGRHDYQDEVKEAYKNGLPLHQEIKVSAHDVLYWFDLRLTPVFDHSGELDLFIAVFTDTTALRMREAEFFKAQKLDALGQLAAGVAHDFNNVLSIIDGYSRMVVSRVNEPDIILSHVEKMQRATKRGAALTRQMLTFSRHKIVVDSVIDVEKAVLEQEALLMPLLGANIALSVEAEGEMLCAECSLDSLTQIILNLGINARDAMPDGGEIKVLLEVCAADDLPKFIAEEVPDTEFLCLSVSDTGMGMDKEIQERIFDPFYTTKEQGKGTGLGLSVVYGMVKEMSGFIHVVSKLSRGTTFYVYIPRSYAEPQKQIKGTLDDLESIELTGYTVLVAEDEPDLRSIICDTLERRGMLVLQAADGNEALVVQDDYVGDIDILLSDVVMPGMDGLKLGELIHSLRPETHVIYMSGYPAKGDMALINLPDDAYFVAKPVDYDVLCQLIFACLTETPLDGSELSKMTVAYWQTQNFVETAGGA